MLIIITKVTKNTKNTREKMKIVQYKILNIKKRSNKGIEQRSYKENKWLNERSKFFPMSI